MGHLHNFYMDDAGHLVFLYRVDQGMYYTMEDERPRRGRGRGHVTYFLTSEAFGDGLVHP